MSVRAKFKVDRITQYAHASEIHLHPVTSGSPENERFYQYTPGGQIVLSTINPEAAKQFAIGQEFYVDFTPSVHVS